MSTASGAAGMSCAIAAYGAETGGRVTISRSAGGSATTDDHASRSAMCFAGTGGGVTLAGGVTSGVKARVTAAAIAVVLDAAKQADA